MSVDATAQASTDSTFNPQITGTEFHTISIQADGRIIVGGRVATAAGQSVESIARLLPDGTADVSFKATDSMRANGYSSLYSLSSAIQLDGKILVSGIFPKTSGGYAPLLRFHTDGALDNSFSVTTTGAPAVIKPLDDGKILVAGLFSVGTPAVTRRLLRLNPDGSLDGSFSPEFDADVRSLDILDDGRILAGGDFSLVNGVFRPAIVRLDANGTVDLSFSAMSVHRVTGILSQPDGNVLVIGTGDRVMRLTENGGLDTTFNSSASLVTAMALQADGKIVIGGYPSSGGFAGVSRLTASGVLETGFLNYATTRFSNGAVVLQHDGKILFCGASSSAGSSSPGLFARVANGTAPSSFGSDSTHWRWLRGGARPEIGNVAFDRFDMASGQWVTLGQGVRLPGGWGIPVTAVPQNAVIRCRGRSKASPRGGVEVSEMFQVGNVSPVIAVATETGAALPSGATIGYGSHFEGSSILRDGIVIRNGGNGLLEGLNLAVTGTNASQFRIERFPSSAIAPGASTTFAIRFLPTGLGSRNATLTISAGNGAAPVVISLTGNASPEFSPHFSNANDVPVSAGSVSLTGKTFGKLTLGFHPALGTTLTAINQNSNLYNAEFPNLPGGSTVSASYEGVVYEFLVGYRGGRDSYDLVFSLIGPGVQDREFNLPVSDSTIGIARTTRGHLITFGERVAELALFDESRTKIANFPPVITWQISPTSISTKRVIPCHDGKFLIIGRFDEVDGMQCVSIARFHGDGSLDQSFVPQLSGAMVSDAVVLEDGKMLVCGYSGELSRLNEDGSIDLSFTRTPPISSSSNSGYSLTPFSDGRVLAHATYISAQNTKMFLQDGTIDSSFTAPETVVYAAEQPDGKIIIYTGINNDLRVQRLFPNGTRDGTFQPTFNGIITSLQVQADGKVLLSGFFNQVNGIWRDGIVRLNADGTVDPTFNASADWTRFVALQHDGKIILKPNDIVSGNRHTGLAGLLNNPGSVAVNYTGDPQGISLVFQGATPVPGQVSLSLMQSGSESWVSRPVTKSGVVWRSSGLEEADRGVLRWSCHPTGIGRSQSRYVRYGNVGGAVPGMLVTDSSGESLESGESGLDFGSVLLREERILKIHVKNTGDGFWDANELSFSGQDAAMFSVVSRPRDVLLPGETGEFSIGFRPSMVGNRGGVLRISSNDPQHVPFELSVSGAGRNSIQPHLLSSAQPVVTVPSFDANGLSLGTITLGFVPVPGTRLVLVNNTGTGPISGRLIDLADGFVVSAIYEGITYRFISGYAGGDGNDLVLTLLGKGGVDPDVVRLPIMNGPVPGVVAAAVPLADGGTLVGGTFTSVGGVPRTHLARFKADGSLDLAFNPHFNARVSSAYVLPDGRMLVGGAFTTMSGEGFNGVVLLLPDGTVDRSFVGYTDAAVEAVFALPGGKSLISGGFTRAHSYQRPGIARLNADGQVDTSFAPGFNGAQQGAIRALAVQQDGKVIIGGSFVGFSDYRRRFLVRLESNGSLDLGFAPQLTFVDVSSLLVQEDGKILVGGASRLQRLLPDGNADSTFSLTTNGAVTSISKMVDGRLLVAGGFTTLNGQPVGRMALLNPDGSLDTSMNFNFTGTPSAVALREDGRIAVGGNFSMVDGFQIPPFINLLGQQFVSTFEKEGNSILRWTRAGQLPEESEVSFELHEAGSMEWKHLGFASRIAGGWELNAGELPSTGVIRSRSAIKHSRGGHTQTIVFPPFGNARPSLLVKSAAGVELQSSTSAVNMSAIPSTLPGKSFVRLENPGTAELDFVIQVSGAGAGAFSLIHDKGPLKPAESRMVEIVFSPASAGEHQAELHVSTELPGANPFVVGLEGRGTGTFSPRFGTLGDRPFSNHEFDFTGMAFGTLHLDFLPPSGVPLVAAENLGHGVISGVLAGAPHGGRVSAAFGEQTYSFIVSYKGGNGNDLTFTRIGDSAPDLGFLGNLSSSASGLAIQPDGGIIAVGGFTSVGTVSKIYIARFHADGSLDTSFQWIAGSSTEAIAVQKDGKVLVGATMRMPGSNSPVNQTQLTRFHEYGSIDTGFVPALSSTVIVRRLVVLSDDKILVSHSSSSGPQASLSILNTDGSLDTSFAAGSFASSAAQIHVMVEQPDGKILIGGTFAQIGGVAQRGIARLNRDGSLDEGFRPVLTPLVPSSAFGVSSMVLQPDGKIVVSGSFSRMNDDAVTNLVRLNSDGSTDSSFQGSLDSGAASMLLLSSGKILVGGSFREVGGVARPGLARLENDGSLDESFRVPLQSTGIPSAGFVMDPAGRLVVSGIFNSVGGLTGGRFVRLSADPVSSSLTTIGTGEVRWARSGNLPELQGVVFEHSQNDGATWAKLGSGNRTAAGWGLDGLSLPEVGGLVRATGYAMATSRSSSFSREVATFGDSFATIEEWRAHHFGSEAGTGDAADLADPDADGIANLVEYAFGLNPKKSSAGFLPVWNRSGNLYSSQFTPTGTAGEIAYGAEWSQTMNDGDWHPAAETGTGALKRFEVEIPADGPLFLRWKISRP